MNTAISQTVHLLLLGGKQKEPPWPLGEVYEVGKSVGAIGDLMRQLAKSDSDACLFWDADLGDPDPVTISSVVSLPGEVWHAGLRLHLSGLPGLLNFVQPTWMYNRDPDPTTIATSWRLSLRACVIKTSVLRHMGDLCPDFVTLEGASLELGHRYLSHGVIVRHVPWLLAQESTLSLPKLPFWDEFLFVLQRSGRKWATWALGRALLTGYAGPKAVMSAFLKQRKMRIQSRIDPFPQVLQKGKQNATSRVTVLIPTLNRYKYLRKLLPQLRQQTVSPAEIILVDQTPEPERDTTIAAEHGDLPLKIFYLNRPGQCSARNEGLKNAKGDHILFLDDDDEVPPDLIESHMNSLQHFRAPVSSGAVNDNRTLPEQFRYIRCSDVFPTGNTMIHRSLLSESGPFDLAYDCGDREDGDLGMRIYLRGALMIFNPNVRVIHHHAAKGGLRTHGVGRTTYIESRKNLFHRKLPSHNEIYFLKRHFSTTQTKERLLLSAIGTLSLHGSALKRTLKLVIGILLLPHTVWQIRKNSRKADRMLERFPQLSSLPVQ